MVVLESHISRLGQIRNPRQQDVSTRSDKPFRDPQNPGGLYQAYKDIPDLLVFPYNNGPRKKDGALLVATEKTATDEERIPVLATVYIGRGMGEAVTRAMVEGFPQEIELLAKVPIGDRPTSWQASLHYLKSILKRFNQKQGFQSGSGWETLLVDDNRLKLIVRGRRQYSEQPTNPSLVSIGGGLIMDQALSEYYVIGNVETGFFDISGKVYEAVRSSLEGDFLPATMRISHIVKHGRELFKQMNQQLGYTGEEGYHFISFDKDKKPATSPTPIAYYQYRYTPKKEPLSETS